MHRHDDSWALPPLRKVPWSSEKWTTQRCVFSCSMPSLWNCGSASDHQARLKTPTASQLTLESYSRTLPQHICAALQQCAMVSKEKTASALDFDPGKSSYWSKRHRDIVFGANYNAFATKFTGFSICFKFPVFPVWSSQCMMTQKCSLSQIRNSYSSLKCNKTIYTQIC